MKNPLPRRITDSSKQRIFCLFFHIAIEELLNPLRISCHEPVMLSLYLITYSLGICACEPVLRCSLHDLLDARYPLAAQNRADRQSTLLKDIKADSVCRISRSMVHSGCRYLLRIISIERTSLIRNKVLHETYADFRNIRCRTDTQTAVKACDDRLIGRIIGEARRQTDDIKIGCDLSDRSGGAFMKNLIQKKKQARDRCLPPAFFCWGSLLLNRTWISTTYIRHPLRFPHR